RDLYVTGVQTCALPISWKVKVNDQAALMATTSAPVTPASAATASTSAESKTAPAAPSAPAPAAATTPSAPTPAPAAAVMAPSFEIGRASGRERGENAVV